MNDKVIRTGIIGAGRIAVKMTDTINKLSGFEAYAVASRNIDRSKAFARDNGVEKYYGSYEELLEDENVDLVYIAVPHSHHYKVAEMCIEHKKNFLCEKSFMLDSKEAVDILSRAEKSNIFAGEAIWTMYMPSRRIIEKLVKDRVVGEIISLSANLGYNVIYKDRVRDKKLGGGALLDLGVYAINFARSIFGNDIEDIRATAVKGESGIDISDSISIRFAGAKTASLNVSVACVSDRRGVLYGEDGYIEVLNINNPERILVYDKNHSLIEDISVPEQISGFEYELMAARDAIINGETECDDFSHSDIIDVMRIIDRVKTEIDLDFR